MWIKRACPHPGENDHVEMKIATSEVSGLLTAFHEDVDYLRDLIDAER